MYFLHVFQCMVYAPWGVVERSSSRTFSNQAFAVESVCLQRSLRYVMMESMLAMVYVYLKKKHCKTP